MSTNQKRILKKNNRRKKKPTNQKETATEQLKRVQKDVYFKLNYKQQRFVDEYLLDYNAYRAYCMAGYSGRGNSGYVAASILMKRPAIIEAIEHRRGLIASTLEVTQAEVIKELKAIAFSNIGDYVQFGGKKVRLKASNELTRDQLSVIEQVVESTNTAGIKSIKLKLHPKLTALGVLAKYTNVDKAEESKTQTVEVLAQALADMSDKMDQTLPTEENRVVDVNKKKKKKKKK